MIKLLIVVWLGSFTATEIHPLHVSVTEINHDEKDKALEIMIRVFADDLETTLRKKHDLPELDILNPKGKSLDGMMQEYLNETFSVNIDGNPQSLHYLGNERDGEAFVFYVEITKVRKWKKVVVTNSILTEIFDDQSNLVHVTSGGTVKSMRLNKSNPSDELAFDN